MRWLWRGTALGALVLGWLFILWANNFHLSAPVVFVALGYLAVVATIYNLWRTGAAVVGSGDDDGDSTWAKPAGALGELEREKRTLLKAIKEAEFDHQMGKLSKRDVDDMIRIYRARAIEVIKEIDRLGQGSAGSARDQILREVRARLELETRSQKKPGKAEAADAKARRAGKASKAEAAKPDAAKPDAAKPDAAKPDAAKPEAAPAVKADGDAAAGVAPSPEARTEGAKPATTDASPGAPAPSSEADARTAIAAAIDADELDADSTTAEPQRRAAKEAV
jgi:hypothetical protein